jgi:peptidoglycan/LPS O-acetylase OafA/YrhL
LLLAGRCGWKTALVVTLAAEIGLRGFAAFRFTTGDAEIPYWMIGAPLFYWFSWSIGAAAADAWLKRRPLPFSRAPIWLFPMLFVGTAFFKPLAMFSFMFASLAMLPLIRVLLERRERWTLQTERRFGRHFRFAGIYSYSIYLIHFPIIVMIPKVMAKFLPSLAAQPLALMAACVLSWFPVMAASRVFYQFLEQPCIALGKSAIRKWFHPVPGHSAVLGQGKA